MFLKLSFEQKFGIAIACPEFNSGVNARLNIRAGRYTFDRLIRVKRNNVQRS